MPVALFEYRPERCPVGHWLGPGRVVCSWTPCGCPDALAGRSGHGHLWILCRGCEEDHGRKTYYYEPAHFADEDRVPGAVMICDGPGGWVSVPIVARHAPLPPGVLPRRVTPES